MFSSLICQKIFPELRWKQVKVLHGPATVMRERQFTEMPLRNGQVSREDELQRGSLSQETCMNPEHSRCR